MIFFSFFNLIKWSFDHRKSHIVTIYHLFAHQKLKLILLESPSVFQELWLMIIYSNISSCMRILDLPCISSSNNQWLKVQLIFHFYLNDQPYIAKEQFAPQARNTLLYIWSKKEETKIINPLFLSSINQTKQKTK